MILVIRHVKARQLALAEGKGNVAAIGDPLCILKRLRIIPEQRAHFFFGFQIKLVGLKLHFVFIADGAACLDAEKYAVQLAV